MPPFRKILATTAICLAAVGLNSCQKTMQVDISLSSAGAPLSFTCCSEGRGYSHIKRCFDVTGVGSTYKEEPYQMAGAGTPSAPWCPCCSSSPCTTCTKLSAGSDFSIDFGSFSPDLLSGSSPVIAYAGICPGFQQGGIEERSLSGIKTSGGEM